MPARQPPHSDGGRPGRAAQRGVRPVARPGHRPGGDHRRPRRSGGPGRAVGRVYRHRQSPRPAAAAQARAFHRWQAEALAGAGLDYLYAGIMPTLPEALGMAQAMGDTGLPYIISFTIQKDGRLIDGTAVDAAIGAIDEGTARPPVCYMTNCVHPDIALQALEQPFNRTERVRARFWGIQANASPLPYDQLPGRGEPAKRPARAAGRGHDPPAGRGGAAHPGRLLRHRRNVYGSHRPEDVRKQEAAARLPLLLCAAPTI